MFLVSRLRRIKRRLLARFYTWRVRRRAVRCGDGLKVNGKTIINHHTCLGTNVNLNGMIIVGEARVTIGDNFHSGEDCLAIVQMHNYDSGEAIPYDDTYILKDIVIEDNVWLGSRVIVLGGVTIGEGAVIQAGSCVVSDIPRCAVAGGHPARVFKYRDIAHYERLKAEGKFH